MTMKAVEPSPAPSISCSLCSAAVDADAAALAGGRPLCASCAAQIERELAAERAPGGRLPALLLGLAGALVGAAVWAGICVTADVEVGYVAILVGFLAGQGVKRGAGRRRSQGLQLMAAALASVGLASAKYMIVSWAAVKMAGLSPFDGVVVKIFFEHLDQWFGGFDILWLLLAVGAAYRQAKPSPVTVVR